MNNKQSRQTHCKWGHEFTEENTRIDRKGSRVCRTCQRLRYVKVEKSNICNKGLHDLTDEANLGHQHGRRFCRPCRDAKAAEWRERNKGYARASRFRLEYGITLDDYADMLEAQGGVCKICRRSDWEATLHVDHDHLTGKVRGLLCQPCNHGLGNFRDDIDLMYKAINYLREQECDTSTTPSFTSEETTTLLSQSASGS